MSKMTVIQLLNKIANGEATYDYIEYWNRNKDKYDVMLVCEENLIYKLNNEDILLIDEVKRAKGYEEEPQEHKIPEKLDIVLLDQSDNWTRKYNKNLKDFESAHIELNPYVIDVIRQNTLEFQSKINEIIDYIEPKYTGSTYTIKRDESDE